MKYEIVERNVTFNDKGRGLQLVQQAIRYALQRKGFLAMSSVPIRMYFRTREGLESPDATISVMPFLTERIHRERRIARERGITMNVNVLRSDSRGSIHIKSADPSEAPAINFNFLSSELDRAGLLVAMRKARDLMAAQPIAGITGKEIAPGVEHQTDEELLEWVRNNAETTYHPVGTSKMGHDEMAEVDDRMRVRGIEGLRI
ncbi:MAG: GMC oxidoreductase, partial [Pseudomonadota bacterium]